MRVHCLGLNSAFRASVNLFNSKLHTKKAIYVTLKLFKCEVECSQFTRIGQVITLHHCEMMRLILEYNDYLEQLAASIHISEGANTSAPVVERDEGEDRPIVVFRPPQKKAKTAAKNPPLKKMTKKTTKQTDEPSPLQPLQIQLQQLKPKKFWSKVLSNFRWLTWIGISLIFSWNWELEKSIRSFVNVTL